MAATLEAVPSTKAVDELTEKSEAEAARELVRMAREQGLSLAGPDGLLKQLTKTVIETALDEELTEHLGYERHDTAAKDTANSRNGTRSQTVLTETIGPAAKVPCCVGAEDQPPIYGAVSSERCELDVFASGVLIVAWLPVASGR